MALMQRRRLAFLSGIAALLLVPAGRARADLVLDQQYDPTSKTSVSAGLNGAITNEKRAETFTVGVAGELDRVDLYLLRFSAVPVGSLILEIRATTGGVPSADPTYLAQTSILASAVTTAGGFVTFDVSAAKLQVTVGEQLAAVLYPSSGGSITSWLGTTNNPYAAGSPYEEQQPNHGWTVDGTYDLGFRTYVTTPNAVPEPGSLAILATGLLGFRSLVRRFKGK